MARITSIKELKAISDDLYTYFVERLTQVTDIETKSIDGVCHSCTEILLHVVKTERCDNCLHIVKWNNGTISFWADDYNGLMIGTISDLNAIEIVRTTKTINDRGFRVLEKKRYINKNGQKTADLKKRAILLELKTKLEELFKDYL